MAASMQNTLVYDGCNYFRQRLVFSTLSGRPVRIRKIRHKDDDPGVKEFEASFIRLIDRITNGSRIEVNESGTVVYYQPGMLVGGTFDHTCSNQRSIGYFLEGILCLVPFTKKPTKIIFRGVTNNQTDPSIDLIKHASFTVLKRFLGVDEGLELKINKRGAAPEGGGEVIFSAPCRQKLRPLNFTDSGKIKRIRGIAWAVRVSPATCNRIVDSARSILNKFLPDIYIYTDHHKGSSSGKSPGFGMTLVAETTGGTFLSAEMCSNPKGEQPTIPEELGIQTSKLLLEEIYRGGCVDSTNQSLACVLMALGDKDVSKVKVGPLSPFTIQTLRHIRDFFQVMFKMDVVKSNDEDEEELRTGGNEKIILTCVGAGYKNLAKVTL